MSPLAPPIISPITSSAPRPPQPWGMARKVLLVLALLLIAAIVLGEILGWPFLAEPLQAKASALLNRSVKISAISGEEPSTPLKPVDAFAVRFIGGLHLYAPQLEIAAPDWSKSPHMLLARRITLDLRYIDLWRAWRGEPIRIERLQADTLDGNLERLADGRASWEFGPVHHAPPLFNHLQVVAGTLRYRDALLRTELDANLSLANGSSTAATRTILPAPGSGATPTPLDNVLHADASGRFRDMPVKIVLQSSGVLPWAADASQATPVPVSVHASIGGATLVFDGSTVDALHMRSFSGHFSVKGPSLAAVGDPLGITLPTTGPFSSRGKIVKKAGDWKVVVDDATVGASRLNGAFSYTGGANTHLLAGKLGGSKLLLADLGPAVGTTTALTAATPETTGKALPKSTRGAAMVLPDRPFDLAALRAMDANVLIDIGEVDLNTAKLEPLKPLHAHLQLVDGVLTLADLDARSGQGHLRGNLQLDGRQSTALWTADLRWNDVKLEQFIHQSRANNAPPYVSGRLNGSAKLKGQGRSTAEILAGLNGNVRTELRDGGVSHFVVEAAGIDFAQGVGMLIKGDDVLPVQCAVADLNVEKGVFRPNVMVLDTSDSAIWVNGSISLASEELDLRAVVTPKDFSPMALRTPVLVRGTIANPKVSLEKGPLAKKVAVAVLLGLINPLAALIPLIDTGDAKAANIDAAGCASLRDRAKAKLPLVVPAAKP